MARMTESTFLSSDGKTDIYCREYAPDGEARGIVQLAHGVAEHITRYDSFAQFLAAHGYLVVGNDHLGHGKSVASEAELGCLGESGGWDHVVEDMHTLHDLTAARYPGKPYYLFGHSMGSFLARTYIIRYRGGLDGVILSGTGQQSKLLILGGGLMGRAEARRHGAAFRSERLQKLAFGKYNDGFDSVRTDFDWLSRDEAVVDAYIADPLCGYTASAGLFRDMMDGLAYLSRPANLDRMRKDLPVYFMSGACDPVGENGKGVTRAYRSFLRAGMTDVSLKLYPGGRHEMLNEINNGEVYQDILAWLDGKSGK